MAEPSRVRRRARKALARVWRPSSSRAKLEADLTQTRSRLRRSRKRLEVARAEGLRLRAEVERLKREHQVTRASVRHPFPDHAVPTPEVARTIEQVTEERLTYLSRDDLRLLAAVVAEAERVGRPGLVVEAGTALGG